MIAICVVQPTDPDGQLGLNTRGGRQVHCLRYQEMDYSQLSLPALAVQLLEWVCGIFEVNDVCGICVSCH